MKVAITGASGLIGSALTDALTSDGHQVVPLSRGGGPSASKAISWDPAEGTLDAAALQGVDHVVHLAGAPIGRPHWTTKHKVAVLDSRVDGTSLIAATMAGMSKPPKTLISGSAVGYYGNRGGEILTEASAPGTGFLAEVVQLWEAATAPADADPRIRVAHIRTGIVVAPDGGAFEPVLIPFKLGIGGKLGSGKQWWPCISIDDEVAAVRFLLDHEDLSGAFNLTAPEPAQMKSIAKTIGKVLHRPTLFPVPAMALKVAVGREMAEQMVLASQRALPERLLEAGFTFLHPTFEDAFRAAVGRPAKTA